MNVSVSPAVVRSVKPSTGGPLGLALGDGLFVGFADAFDVALGDGEGGAGGSTLATVPTTGDTGPEDGDSRPDGEMVLDGEEPGDDAVAQPATTIVATATSASHRPARVTPRLPCRCCPAS